MAFFLKTFLVFGLFVSLWEQSIAAPPSLTLNPSEFSYNATVTAVLVENCTELSNPNNILIASVNGQVRGYVNSSTVVGNRYMAFLTVYSNKASGDTLVFQIYKADTDQLLAVKTKLVFQEDGIYGTPSVPQEVQTNNRPTDLALSSLQIPEHLTPNQNLATISAKELDRDNTLSYSLVTGTNSTDNALFQAAGNQLQAKGLLNTALKDTFQIRLQVADNLGCTLEKAFSLVVDKVNDTPTNLQLTDSLFSENEPSPSIGAFIATDPDFNDSFTFSFVAGTGDADNSQFAIAGTLLSFNSIANYEAKKVYHIRCRVTDRDGLFFDKAFTLYVKDKNDPPTNIVLSNNKIFENESSTQFVAKLYSIDEDAVDKYEYTFANVGTNDNFSFTIAKDTLRANKVFDFETKSNYVVYLISTDSMGVPVTKPFVITIKDTLDIPTDIQLSNATVTENATSRTAIGILSTVDANVPVPSYVYSFVTGKGSTDNSSFTIRNDTLYTKDTLDFEVKNRYSVRVRTSLPNGMNTEKEFPLSVLDIPSTGIVLSNTRVYENEPVQQFVAKISTISQDKDDQYSYSFGNVGTNDNTNFLLSNDTLWANKVFDFESKSSYSIYITSTSLSGVPITKSFVIGIKDSLDVPTDLAISRTVIEENQPAKNLLGVLSTVDANTPPVLYTYTFVAGTGNVDSSLFQISHDSVYARQTFDAETKTNYQIRVRSTLVNKMYVEKAFSINVLNVNEPPTFTSLSHDSIPENTADSTFVGYLNSVDQDVNESFRYSFVTGTRDADNKAFALKGNSLFLVKAANFENKSFYRIQIRTTDKAGLFLDSLYTIHIVDVNEAPKIVINSYEIEELSDPGTSIGLVEVKDEDKNQTFAYTILNPDVPFSINSSTGELTLKGPIDYESKTSYDLLIKVKDSGSPILADSLTLTVNILDEIENDQLPSADLVSPNGDGSNDYWKIRNVYLYSEYTLQIYDQNSQLVYSVARNYNNDWDAKLNGQTLPNGIYYYTFKSNTDDKLFKGYITVLK